jgi:hypothetical protein
MAPELLRIHGQPSFTLATRSVQAAISRFGGMLAPVKFFADSDAPIQPYAIAPWATESMDTQIPRLLTTLRGDFMCSAFGDNAQPWDGRVIPPHGDAANAEWEFVGQREQESGSALRLQIDMPTQGGKCVATTALLLDHQFVYQRHDFPGFSGDINPGHHALLQCSQASGRAQISFSRSILVGSSPPRAALAEAEDCSRLRPGSFGADVTALPSKGGSMIDASSFPSHSATDDVLIVCADPQNEFSWSAAVFPKAGYAWLSLRNTADLPSTLVWQSNGGLAAPPWNSRHVGVLGLEDVMGYFSLGLAESAAENELTRRGVATCRKVMPGEVLRIPYIQGLVRLPPHVDRIVAVRQGSAGKLLLAAANGSEFSAACRWEFLRDGLIPGLCED